MTFSANRTKLVFKKELIEIKVISFCPGNYTLWANQ